MKVCSEQMRQLIRLPTSQYVARRRLSLRAQMQNMIVKNCSNMAFR